MSAEKIREYLLIHGVPYQVHEHALAYTTSGLAEAEQVSGKQIAKPVILLADGRFVMAVVPGHRHVDLEKARIALGCDDARLAAEDEFASVFEDCERGAEPPLGHLYGMRTLIDMHFDTPEVTFRGGSHTQTITMGLEDFHRVVRAEVADLVAGS